MSIQAPRPADGQFNPSMTAQQYEAQMHALSTVQRRVLAIGFVTITLHAVIALVFVAEHMNQLGRVADAWLMLFMSAFASVVTVAVTRLILGRSPFSITWHAVCLAIPVFGSFWAMG